MLRCVFCKGLSKKGVHDTCWREFKGFMLSDRVSFGTDHRGEAYDELNTTGQDYVDNTGRNVVQGKTMPVSYPEMS